jgi:putative ABC transport system ATP-binding protein
MNNAPWIDHDTRPEWRGPPVAAPHPVISIRQLSRWYQRGAEQLRVLTDIDLDIPEGSFEVLMGPSGSGKSTLLNLIAGLDRPSAGSLVVAGVELAGLGEAALARWRAASVGFVFQSYHLMPILTALENVELPLLLTDLSAAERRQRAEMALGLVGLLDRSHHRPHELSGGQQQRTSIARAIVTDPRILVADEPTGDLDRESADHVMSLLQRLHHELGKTIIMVTHDPAAAERGQRVRVLDRGVLRPVHPAW